MRSGRAAVRHAERATMANLQISMVATRCATIGATAGMLALIH
jgi:hypothetical protein